MKRLLPVALLLAGVAVPAPYCRGDNSPAPVPIRLVLIDEKTETSIGPLPWPRSRHAEMIRILSKAGAKAVVLRMYFRGHGEEEADRKLVAAASDSGRVYVEMSKAHEQEGPPYEEDWLSRMSIPVEGKAPRKTVKLKYAQLPFSELGKAAKGVGSVDILLDRDGTLKGIPLFVRYSDRIFPSLALRIFLDLKGSAARPLAFEKKRFLWIGSKRLNLDGYGCTPVNLRTGNGYSRSSFVDVLKGRVKPALFKDSVVIVSPAGPEMKVATAAGSRNAAELLADQLATLFDALEGTAPRDPGVK